MLFKGYRCPLVAEVLGIHVLGIMSVIKVAHSIHIDYFSNYFIV